MKPLRVLTLLVIAVLALGLAACGDSEDEAKNAEEAGSGVGQKQSEAETEGIYVEVGGLKYQVQISRLLNPLLVADRNYFDGVAGSDRQIQDDEVWFGVFLRAENEGDQPVRAASRFEIKDTQENVYLPVRYTEDNPFAYKPDRVDGHELLPVPDSPGQERQPNGALLLFKLKRAALDNRPLELVIDSPTGDGTGTVNLDV